MVYFDNKIISLNSAYGQKINGSLSSSLLFNFQGILKEETNILRTYISVVNAQIPVSFYTINSTNNTLIYYYQVSTLTITIPVGNYNATNLITALNTAFTTNGSIIVVSINKLTGVLSFNSANTFTFSSNSSLAKTLGIYFPTITTNYLIATYPLNLLGIKNISIKSSKLSLSGYSSTKLGYSSTLATIPVDSASFNLISYVSNNDLNKHIIKVLQLDAIDIQIMDENDNLIDFNNLDWTITLCLSIERQEIVLNTLNLHEVIRNNQTIPQENTIEPIVETQDEKELNLLTK